ncbi:MAG: esterase family protein [Bacteroidaceae bacterium]|nr:esterase family protein [Bacteroidaceae bacterium]
MKTIRQFLLLSTMLLSLPSLAGRIVTDTVKSQILSADVPLNVYLPDGYDIASQRFPIIYLLHGLSDDFRAWRDKGQMQSVVDELIGTGECVPVVIVMPNAGGPDTHNTWNGYFNMPGWSYEDFFFQEFLPKVEEKYHAVGDKEHRAVMGLSMGGGGSTVYCQRHPELFSSCYAMSPWLDHGSNDVGAGQEKDKRYYVCEAVREHSALRFVEQADEETKERLRTVKWFFDCGDDDFLFDQSIRMHQLMRSARIHDELRVRNGVHNWEYWHQALRMALPFASRNFAK